MLEYPAVGSSKIDAAAKWIEPAAPGRIPRGSACRSFRRPSEEAG